jgi:glutamate--cysteine ligase
MTGITAATHPAARSTVVRHKRELIEYLAAGAKPEAEWRIGTEHEKFAYTAEDRWPLPYNGVRGIRALLEGMQRFGWEPRYEQENPVALAQGNAAITLEPGGQFELSGAPLENLHQTCDEVNEHLRQVKEVADELGVRLIGLGFHPKWPRTAFTWMPKQRYAIMREYMPSRGAHGLDMMLRTCCVQVNLDYSSEADMRRKLRVGLALQPLATALFANSPFVKGRPSGFLSYRAFAWRDTDPDRCGLLPFMFEDSSGFERYVDYALDVPMYFVIRGDRYINAAGQSFRDFLDGRLPALPGERPTLEDWSTHLSTLYPEVRLKRFLEMRGADGGPWKRLCALPAFWTGLLYDASALESARDLVKDWTPRECERLHREVPRLALRASIRGRTLHALAREVLEISREGLRRRACLNSRGEDETRYLDPLAHIVETGRTPAEELIVKYHDEWKRNVDPLFEEYAY